MKFNKEGFIKKYGQIAFNMLLSFLENEKSFLLDNYVQVNQKCVQMFEYVLSNGIFESFEQEGNVYSIVKKRDNERIYIDFIAEILAFPHLRESFTHNGFSLESEEFLTILKEAKEILQKYG